jgi:CheY-like chemotaxis protein
MKAITGRAGSSSEEHSSPHAPGPAEIGKLRSEPVTQEIELPPRPADRSQPCVLVVSSQLSYASAVCELLRVDGRRVDPAGTGLEALRLLAMIDPDIVLCDLEMRGIPSSYGVARAVRSHPGLEHVRLIGLTARDPAACQEQAMRAGFDDVVRKTGDIAPIEAVIARHWSRT